ncbi:unnamed protein product, partial [Pylaiella littoralis]
FWCNVQPIHGHARILPQLLEPFFIKCEGKCVGLNIFGLFLFVFLVEPPEPFVPVFVLGESSSRCFSQTFPRHGIRKACADLLLLICPGLRERGSSFLRELARVSFGRLKQQFTQQCPNSAYLAAYLCTTFRKT